MTASASSLAVASASLLWLAEPPPISNDWPWLRDYKITLGLGLCLGVALSLGFGIGRAQPTYGTSTTVYTGSKDSRVHGTGPCTRAVHCCVHDRLQPV